TRADLIGAEPKLLFTLDEDKVRLAGLELSSVAEQLQSSLTGALGGSLIEATEELPVRVRLAAEDRESVAALRRINIMPPSSRQQAQQGGFPGIPVLALGEIALVPSDSPIARRDGKRVNTIQGFVVHGVLPEEALKVVLEKIDANPIALPPGYRLELGGDSDARAETNKNLAGSAGLVVTLTVVTIFLTFFSYRLSIIVAVVAGLAMGLSVLALAIFQYPFGIQALIGAIGSIGVSVNAAIIILTGLQANPRAMAGDLVAIRETVSRSARHIVSTTITTVGGFIPLIVEGGGFWPPFAMAIAGGVLLSTVVSFYFTPPMFALLMARGKRNQKTAEPETFATGHAVPAE
ncbi:MAG: efflux RND transporter permease subunit, partial [Pseudomonadota bacterium]